MQPEAQTPSDAASRPDLVSSLGGLRLRCDACGNLTRFDVIESRKTKAFYHFTIGGEIEVEEAEVLESRFDEILCRWCGHGRSVVFVDAPSDGAARAQQTLEN